MSQRRYAFAPKYRLDAKLLIDKCHLDFLCSRNDGKWYDEHINVNAAEVEASRAARSTASKSYSAFALQHFGLSLMYEQREVIAPHSSSGAATAAPAGAGVSFDGSVGDLAVKLKRRFVLMPSSIAVSANHVLLSARQLASARKVVIALLVTNAEKRRGLVKLVTKVSFVCCFI